MNVESTPSLPRVCPPPENTRNSGVDWGSGATAPPLDLISVSRD